MRLSVVVVEPEVVDEISERMGRLIRPVQHAISLKKRSSMVQRHKARHAGDATI